MPKTPKNLLLIAKILRAAAELSEEDKAYVISLLSQSKDEEEI